MQAIVVDAKAPSRLVLSDAPEPRPTPGEVLVAVEAFSLNFGDVFVATQGLLEDGSVPGYEAAGVVVQAAGDGSGPPQGTRVTTFGLIGAWAERRAVPVAEVATLPDGVGFEAASTLPAAGVSALRALRRPTSLLGRRVLVTGASGGVGRYCVQLAAIAGARVIASVGDPARAVGLREIGAAEVVVGLDQVDETVDVVLEHVGGRVLADAFALLGSGGVLVSVGCASMQPTMFEALATVSDPRRRLETFMAGSAMGEDAEYLARLVDAGRLTPEIGWTGSWEQVDEAIHALRARRVRGKAVLQVSGC